MSYQIKSIETIFQINNPVYFLNAHPDDETFLSGGLINELSRKTKVILIYLAAGLLIDKPITLIRQNECMKAARLLGAEEVYFLDYCDKKYANTTHKALFFQNVSEVANNIVSIIGNLKSPFSFISYDKNGGYGHSDHIIVHRVGRHVAAIKRNLVLEEITMNRDKIIKWLNYSKGLGENLMPKTSYWSQDFWFNENNITSVFKLTREQLILKREAFSKYHSQMVQNEFPLALPEADFSNFFDEEFLHSPRKQHNV